MFKYRNEVILTNLNNAFPEKAALELKQIKKQFQHHFTDIFIQAIKVLCISKKQAEQRVSIKNIDAINYLHSQGKSVIVYAAHLGNWEWMAFLPLHIRHQFISFYQEQSNSYFNGLMMLIRQRFGNLCVESKQGYKVLKEFADQNKPTLTYVIGDQSPTYNAAVQWTTFLNQDTAFLIGADKMAKRLNQSLFYARMTVTKRGNYEVEYIPMDVDVNSDQVIETYAHLLEENIIDQPYTWLWSHRRWKRKKD